MRAVEIAVSPLFSLLQRENLGDPHTLLTGGERYSSPRFAAEAERVIQRELTDSGLGDEREYRKFVELVTVVQHATVEFYGWITGVDENYGVLVASLGRRAVSAVRVGDTVRFELCAADRMVEVLVSRLPEVPAGRGDAFTVGHADFHSRPPAGTVLRRPTRPEKAQMLDKLLDTQRRYVTKIYAAKRNDDGCRQRSQRWVTVLDLVDGRWVLSVTQARGEKWIGAGPGSPQVISDRLVELARSVR